MFLELRITDSLNMLVRSIDWFFSRGRTSHFGPGAHPAGWMGNESGWLRIACCVNRHR
jgi:hypothetical protein